MANPEHLPKLEGGGCGMEQVADCTLKYGINTHIVRRRRIINIS